MCGFCHSTFFTTPVTVTGFVASYSAENEWCENAAPANRNRAPNKKRMIFMLNSTSLHLVMDDLAVNHRKDRADLFDLLVLHAEIILVENSQIRQFTRFNRADLIFQP